MRIFFQKFVQRLAEYFVHHGGDFAGNQFVFGLGGEFRVGQLHGKHAHQAFAHIVAAGVHLGFLSDFVGFDILVDGACHGGAQGGEVGAAVALRDVVGETLHGFLVAVVPLHGAFYGHAVFFADGVEDFFVQGLFVAGGVAHETGHAAGFGEVFVFAVAFVKQFDFHAVVQKG